jgi:5-methylcytosine-specific restriction endonuclease McrA
MSRTHIPKWLRENVATQARHRCGYCQADEQYFGTDFVIDHLTPEALGGKTIEENLWLACWECNGRKASRVAAIDPISRELVPLYNPRTQAWGDHFRWTATGDQLLGLSPTGRATIRALGLNLTKRVVARQFWVKAGWHPPKD